MALINQKTPHASAYTLFFLPNTCPFWNVFTRTGERSGGDSTMTEARPLAEEARSATESGPRRALWVEPEARTTPGGERSDTPCHTS